MLGFIGKKSEMFHKFKKGEAHISAVGQELSESIIYNPAHVIQEQRRLPQKMEQEVVIELEGKERVLYNSVVGNCVSNLICSRYTGEDCITNDALAANTAISNVLKFFDALEFFTASRRVT